MNDTLMKLQFVLIIFIVMKFTSCGGSLEGIQQFGKVTFDYLQYLGSFTKMGFVFTLVGPIVWFIFW